MTFASAWDVAADHIVSFVLGLIVGFAGTSRYRIVKRNGGDNDGQ